MGFKKNLAVLGLLGTGMMISASSQAITITTTTTFYISANCADCAIAASTASFPVTAELTLDNYTLGDTITTSNFVSFFYSGSNLVDPYSITASGDDGNAATNDFSSGSIYDIGGNIANVPGQNNFDVVFDDGLFFRTFTDGTWSTCAPGPAGYYGGNSCFPSADEGANALYSLTPVPEPSHLAMMLAGLGCLVPVLRKRQIKA